MAYAHTNAQGRTYSLHAQKTTLPNGKMQTLYFFAKGVKVGALDAALAGCEVSETKSGLPVLRRAQSLSAARRSRDAVAACSRSDAVQRT